MPDESTPAAPRAPRAAMREWLLRPPRAHGEQLEHRAVSYLELFYDLVFVVFVSQIASGLAENVTWHGVLAYVVLFSLLWLLWLNGSSYHEIHGRDDGRGRTLIFAQMGMLAVLSVYARDATGVDGKGFAWCFALLLAVQTSAWYSVQRIDDPRFFRTTSRYIAGLIVGMVLAVASALVQSDDTRLVIWAVLAATLFGSYVFLVARTPRQGAGFRITESMVERFSLFTIIVLGEVVVSVVDGLSAAGRDAGTIATGVLALAIGFGFWWTYFDLVGLRTPRDEPISLAVWMFGHLPVSLFITAAGAGMVGLVEHATDGRTPQSQAWLIAGSVAAFLLSMIWMMRTLDNHERLRHVHRPLVPALLVAAVAVVVIGALHPAPWLLALLILVVLGAVWVLGFVRTFGAGFTPSA